MQVIEPNPFILQRESHVLAYKMKDYSSIRFDNNKTADDLKLATGEKEARGPETQI